MKKGFVKNLVVLLLLFLMTFALNVNATQVTTNSAKSDKNFSDVDESHWAYKIINKMTEKEIIKGYPDGTYKPEDPVTREQFATVLVETLELPKTNSIVDFADVADDRWSKPAIDAAINYLNWIKKCRKVLF